jgi:branched-chain amino acid transport system ATP-binding protein
LTEATAPVAAAESAGPILRLRGVGRRFGGVQAVRDVDLDVAHGERRAILGPNGAGKTTLFNLIAGDFQPTSGTIEVMGSDVTNLPARMRPRLGVARTYQKSRLFPGLSVEDNLYLAIVGRDGRRLRPLHAARERELRERARAAAERVWLADSFHELVGSLSHGQQRQLEVGMASATEPKLMMLDEPASGLSRGERERLTDLLLSLPADVTLLLIEHDMDIALRVAGYVTMMHDGAKIVEGTPEEIRGNQTVHDIYLGSRFTNE